MSTVLESCGRSAVDGGVSQGQISDFSWGFLGDFRNRSDDLGGAYWCSRSMEEEDPLSASDVGSIDEENPVEFESRQAEEVEKDVIERVEAEVAERELAVVSAKLQRLRDRLRWCRSEAEVDRIDRQMKDLEETRQDLLLHLAPDSAAVASAPEQDLSGAAGETRLKERRIASRSDQDHEEEGDTLASCTKRRRQNEEEQSAADSLLREDSLHLLLAERRAARPSPTGQVDDGDIESAADAGDVRLEGDLTVPAAVWHNLLVYQKDAVRWMWGLHNERVGGVIGDEMGLGKTVQVIAFLAALHYSELFGPALVVCPSSVVRQWVWEIQKWWPPFHVFVFPSAAAETARNELIAKCIAEKGILIVSYETLRIHRDLLVSRPWEYAVLDEGHRIRNPDAETTVICKSLRTSHRLLLSGTPIQNRLSELWSLFDFCYPGKLGSLPAFVGQYALPISHGGYAGATAQQREEALRASMLLRDTIQPYLLRRMKKDVNSYLPRKTEQIVFCKLTPFQLSLYRMVLASREVSLAMDGKVLPFRSITFLRKICNHPLLLEMGATALSLSSFSGTAHLNDGADSEVEPGICQQVLSSKSFKEIASRSGKLLVLLRTLRQWKKEGHKVLLFSQSRQMLDILERCVFEENHNFVRLDGTTALANRPRIIDAFNQNPDIFVFLLTTRAGGLGLNLTAANRVVIFDPDWNPSTDVQARERAWRLGQRREVAVFRFIATGTVEEKMYHRQIFKQYMSDRVLKNPKTATLRTSALARNELHDLFSLDESTYSAQPGRISEIVDETEEDSAAATAALQSGAAAAPATETAILSKLLDERSLVDAGGTLLGAGKKMPSDRQQSVAGQISPVPVSRDDEAASASQGLFGRVSVGSTSGASGMRPSSVSSSILQKISGSCGPLRNSKLTDGSNRRSALLQEIVGFLDGRPAQKATTSELVSKFRDRIPKDDAMLFRTLLREAADFRNSEWVLKR